MTRRMDHGQARDRLPIPKKSAHATSTGDNESRQPQRNPFEASPAGNELTRASILQVHGIIRVDREVGPGQLTQFERTASMVDMVVGKDDPPKICRLKAQLRQEPQDGPVPARVTRVDDRKPVRLVKEIRLAESIAGQAVDHLGFGVYGRPGGCGNSGSGPLGCCGTSGPVGGGSTISGLRGWGSTAGGAGSGTAGRLDC